MLYGVGLWILASFVALVLGGFLSDLTFVGIYVIPPLYIAAWVRLILSYRERPMTLWGFFTMWAVHTALSVAVLGGVASSGQIELWFLAGLPFGWAVYQLGVVGDIAQFAVMLALCGLCVALLIGHYRANKRPKT